MNTIVNAIVEISASFLADTGFGFEFLISLVLCAGHMPRRSYFAARMAGAVALVTIFLWGWNHIFPVTLATSIVHYIVFFALIVACAVLCWAIDSEQALVVTIAAGILQHCCYRAASLIGYGISDTAHLSLQCGSYMYVLSLIPIFILGWWCFARLLRFSDFHMNYRSFIPLTGGMLVCANILTNAFESLALDTTSEVRFVFALFDLVSSFFFMMLLLQMMKRHHAENNSLVLERMLAEQRKQLASSKEVIDLINIKTHDVKKQLGSLGRLIDPQEQAELQEMLNIYDSTVDTGNDTLDVVLQEKSLICEKRKIRFERIVDGKLLYFVRSHDIYALFGNALDNAIEAVSHLEEEKRYISLDVRQNRAMIAVVVKNPFEGTVEFVDDLPRTTTGDDAYHGFGTRSIRMITQRYGGVMAISTDDNIFTLSLLIPVR
ncbi:ATP-binding protein [Alloscardovia theropitheci]|uniref:ATP-binding protein n=1 Tax=Alloscardovia theropitheci TaxID=2496842 RepID=A0A4R0QS13_9BIFI|nr:ATP-binding protein [Alloscardovia theropitheci]TCD53875.1 ATP-binding protein [Alloscardovia theropitheci]